MQIVSIRDNLHEMSSPVLWKKNKKNHMNCLSAELAQSVKACSLRIQQNKIEKLSLFFEEDR